MTTTLRPDELEARACRAMLAALKESVSFVCDAENVGSLYERRDRLAQWRKVRAVIAQAEAAGIKADD